MTRLKHSVLVAGLTAVQLAAAEPAVRVADASTAPLHLRTTAAEQLTAPPRPDTPVVLHTEPGQGAALIKRLRAEGARMYAYFPNYAYLVAGIAPAKLNDPSITSISAWSGRHAVTPELRALANGAAHPLAGMVGFIASFTSAVHLGEAHRALTAAGAEVRWIRQRESVHQLGATASTSSLPAIADALDASEGLLWADVQPALRAVNYRTVWRTQSGEQGHTPIFDHGLHGEGQIIAIADTGIDADSCFFVDPDYGLPAVNGRDGVLVSPLHRKILAVDFLWDAEWPDPGPGDWDTHGHGSHVAGTAAGDSNGDGRHQNVDGMAPAAKLIMQDGGFWPDDCTDFPGFGCPPYPFDPMLQQAYTQGARIHSNSYGDEENFTPHNRYTERTADMDRFIWEHRDFVIVAAAGNEGTADGSVISPSTGKNVISVAASWSGDLDPQCPATFSSRGWTHDGRVKPDLMANGSGVISAGNDGDVESMNCFSAQMGGTSMATPAVAGLAALVRQYFMDGFYPTGSAVAADGFSPSSALVRAVLIASAVDLSSTGCADVTPIPSREQGWGFVQLNRALAFADSDFRLWVDDAPRAFDAAPDHSALRYLELQQAGPLKVVLSWTDPPSSSLAAINLVNDLDLTVSGPAGEFLGNHLVGGISTPGGEPDRRNNVEVVWLPHAEPGIWTIRVSPHAVNLPGQDFALAVTGRVVPRDAMREVRGDRKHP